ncbi:type II toxin-antitoxin system HigB family toxin [Pseudoxanthomonas sp. 22568]|uniref:type II toxin-antitoxin system HigB family toxin n=1 Tax=Pseudoxanthomonas sp. 22568 TaxID=3453945 RepID=UPI003F85DCC9
MSGWRLPPRHAAHTPQIEASQLGNDYRLVTAVAYSFQAIYIKFIGTHAEYDEIDVATVEYKP